MNHNQINVLFNSNFSLSTFEPTQIYYIHEYDFVVSLYSTLFENDPSGNVVGGIAQSYEWNGNKLKIELRTDHKSSSGKLITADDVVASINRTLKLEDANHGSLNKYVSKETLTNNIIEKTGMHTVIFNFEAENAEVLKVLTNPEWSILPKESLTHPKWKVDYTNTSGVYFIDREAEDGIILKVNKQHYRYSKKLADNIKLFSIGHDEKTVFKAVESNAIDVVPIFYGMHPISMLNRFSENSDFKIHMTQNIQLQFIQFTKKGAKDLPVNRRLELGSLFRDIYKKETEGRNEVKLANAFFSVFGMSVISPELEKKVNEQYKQSISKNETGTGLIIQARSEEVKQKYIDRFSGYLPNAKYHVPANIKADNISNIIIGNIDSGFDDDLALLSYCASIGIFDAVVSSSAEWLDEYTRSDKKKRKIMFNELHEKMLVAPSIVPIRTLPYVALTKLPWTINQTNLTASMPFWTIEHE